MTPTIVLIPGLMNDAWVWRQQMSALSRRGQIMIACNDRQDTLAGMAQYIVESTHGPLAVAGHSMGGRVALEVARIAPDRVTRLALLATGADAAVATETESRMALVELARTKGMDAVIRAWLPPMLAADVPHQGEIWNGIADMLRRASLDILERQQHALITRRDANDVLDQLDVPIALIAGEHDAWSTPDQHGRMAARAKHPMLTIVRGSGHMIPVEQPDALTSALMDWLTA